MGKISVLSQNQKVILDELVGDKSLAGKFYFTGGTALAEAYFGHRVSEDLDFFSEEEFDTQLTLAVLEKLAKKYNLSIEAKPGEMVQMYFLKFASGEKIKIDFGYYPYRRLVKSTEKRGEMWVDSLQDIIVNKLLATTQRTEVKDFVDLYFGLEKYTFWDLRDGVEAKFRMEVDPYTWAVDLTAVEGFETLPKMVKPLGLEKLKEFYRNLAKRLGMTGVEK
ncbi:MAG: hypothetical protein G01um101416_1030 [Microgenomates group bacterium Gr01-1014_16]|nr:MAG: hypothetical protein G01um101416_1030 [Microgenomates group bacterium Gr01-1014_16]